MLMSAQDYRESLRALHPASVYCSTSDAGVVTPDAVLANKMVARPRSRVACAADTKIRPARKPLAAD